MSLGQARYILSFFALIISWSAIAQFDYHTLDYQPLRYDTLPVPEITKREFVRFGSKDGLRNNFKHLGAEEGLENLKVQRMFQDSRDNIWLGSDGTFTRFNGREIWHYTLEGVSKAFYAIIEDEDGNMWFGSHGNGIFKYDGNHFLKVVFPDSTMNAPDIATLDATKDSQGTILFSSNKHGVIAIEKDRVATFDKNDGLKSHQTLRLHVDDDERLWVGYWDHGISVLEDGIWHSLSKDTLQVDHVNSIDQGLNGKVIVSSGTGASMVDFASGEFTMEKKLPDKRVGQAAVDGLDRIWFAIKREDGCYVLDKDSLFSFSVGNGLAQERALSVMKDNRNNMWVGSFSKGASVYSIDLFDHFNEDSGLKSGRSYGLLEVDDYGFLIGGNGGLHVRKNQEFIKSDLFPDLDSTEVYDVFRQSNGDLWIAAAEQGLFRKRSLGRVDFYKKPQGGANWIFDMEEGADGEMYFVGYPGLMKIDGDRLVHVELNGKPVLDKMRSIAKDATGALWMGGEGCGLIHWNYDSEFNFYADSLTILGANSGIMDEGSETPIMDILFDSEDNFWFTAWPGGLYRANFELVSSVAKGTSTDSITWDLFSSNSGLPSRFTSSIVEENPGRVWVGTGAGLARIDFNESDTTIRAYGSEFGLLSPQIVHNNAFKDKQGKLWWTSEGFVTRYNPDLDYKDVIPPKVNLEGIVINSKNIDFRRPEEKFAIIEDLGFFRSYFKNFIHYSGVRPWANLPEGLVLSYDQNDLLFNFSAPVWDRPEKTQFEAMLLGRDDNWTIIGNTEPFRSFNLNPGEYTLLVKAINADGVKSEAAEYSFTVMPPIWRTNGFYALIIFIAATGAVIYFRHRVKALKKENINLENAVLRRTEELRRSKKKSDDLLLNILPEFTADELKEKGKAETREFDSASVLFSDFEGFTRLSQDIDSQELVSSLDEFFIAFDEIGQRFDIEKIKTIGDSYMCASGIPVEDEHHAVKIVAFGLEMIKATDEINQRRKDQGKSVWKMRLGAHSGPLIAGVVGKKKFAFDIWGDTVNTAARLEQNGVEGEINVSKATFNTVSHVFKGKSRGLQEVKGKGKVEMFLISGFRPQYCSNDDPKIAGEAFEKLITTTSLLEK